MVQVKRLELLRIRLWGCIINRVTSSGNQTPEAQWSAGPATAESKPFKPIERKFGGSYRSYRINGRPKMDVETFFNRIRKV